jgi:hypothetical protein
MWEDVDWHVALTTRIHTGGASAADEGRRSA